MKETKNNIEFSKPSAVGFLIGWLIVFGLMLNFSDGPLSEHYLFILIGLNLSLLIGFLRGGKKKK